ncbi:hypothetical protein GCM10010170_026150 [Dactylosporangium salmoneum]|uniref:Uncharacterized protein n=1 Tax=Dactylosporangium salmoneum TaxID=53361 RepID=A0ABN3G1A7_9ACTN
MGLTAANSRSLTPKTLRSTCPGRVAGTTELILGGGEGHMDSLSIHVRVPRKVAVQVIVLVVWIIVLTL